MKFVLLVLFTCSLFVSLNSRALSSGPDNKPKSLAPKDNAAKPFDLLSSTLKVFKAQYPVGTALPAIKEAIVKLKSALKSPPSGVKVVALKKKLKYLTQLKKNVKKAAAKAAKAAKIAKKGNY